MVILPAADVYHVPKVKVQTAHITITPSPSVELYKNVESINWYTPTKPGSLIQHDQQIKKDLAHYISSPASARRQLNHKTEDGHSINPKYAPRSKYAVDSFSILFFFVTLEVSSKQHVHNELSHRHHRHGELQLQPELGREAKQCTDSSVCSRPEAHTDAESRRGTGAHSTPPSHLCRAAA